MVSDGVPAYDCSFYLPEMEQVEYAIGVDPNRSSIRWRVCMIALGIHQSSLWRIRHSHCAPFSTLALFECLLNLLPRLFVPVGGDVVVTLGAAALRWAGLIVFVFCVADFLQNRILGILI